MPFILFKSFSVDGSGVSVLFALFAAFSSCSFLNLSNSLSWSLYLSFLSFFSIVLLVLSYCLIIVAGADVPLLITLFKDSLPPSFEPACHAATTEPSSALASSSFSINELIRFSSSLDVESLIWFRRYSILLSRLAIFAFLVAKLPTAPPILPPTNAEPFSLTCFFAPSIFSLALLDNLCPPRLEAPIKSTISFLYIHKAAVNTRTEMNEVVPDVFDNTPAYRTKDTTNNIVIAKYFNIEENNVSSQPKNILLPLLGSIANSKNNGANAIIITLIIL